MNITGGNPNMITTMYIVVIAWLYVALMMAVAEATSSQGSLLGAIFTFLLYGLVPVSIAVYLMGTPLRRKRRLRLEAEQLAAKESASREPDAGSHATGALDAHPTQGGVPAVREKP